METGIVRFGKKQVLAIVGAVAIGLSGTFPALAAETGQVSLNLTIQEGQLSLASTTESVQLGDGNVKYGETTNAKGKVSFVVNDGRGDKSPKGWRVTAQVEDFRNNDANATIGAKNMTGVADNVQTTAGNNPPQPTQPVALDSSKSVLVAEKGAGAGVFSADLNLSLAIPQYARPGSYTSKLVLSVVSGPQ